MQIRAKLSQSIPMFYHICPCMASNYHYFQHQGTVLGYSQKGRGHMAILAFHGFGQDHTAFNGIADALGDKFTFFSFHLFFHGKSQWPFNEAPLTKTYWKVLMEKFLAENSIERFQVLGFSLGGKFVLACLEAFPAKVLAAYLLAPDGIKTNFWYRLATYPLPFRRLFKSMILKPGRFATVGLWAQKLGLVDRGVMRFAGSQMNTEEKRKRVYYSWVVFRQLKFDMDAMARLINSNTIGLYVFIGKFDKIITEKMMARLLRQVPSHQLQTLQAGHNDLIEKSIVPLRNIGVKSH